MCVGKAREHDRVMQQQGRGDRVTRLGRVAEYDATVKTANK